jgi:hypothetical protein
MLKIKVAAVIVSFLLIAIPVAAQTNSGSPLSGCIQKSGDVYTLADDHSKNIVQLRGGRLKAGQHVQVTGAAVANATPSAGASQLFDVSSVTQTSGSCPGGRRGVHLSKAHVISIGLVGGLVVFGIVKAAGRIGPNF